MFGDFHQLPPMNDQFIFNQTNDCSYHRLAGPVLWRKFKFYQLNEIVRQNDILFITALNNLAKGKLTNEDFNLFLTRVVYTQKDCKGINLFLDRIGLIWIKLFKNWFDWKTYTTKKKDKLEMKQKQLEKNIDIDFVFSDKNNSKTKPNDDQNNRFKNINNRVLEILKNVCNLIIIKKRSDGTFFISNINYLSIETVLSENKALITTLQDGFRLLFGPMLYNSD